MLIDLGLFILSSFLIYALFRIIKYDSQSDFSISEKIITFLHIFIPYLLIFLFLIIGFYLDVARSCGGFGMLFALVLCKLTPNISLFFSATKDRKKMLYRFFHSHQTDMIYGYLLAVLIISIFQKSSTLVISIMAYFVGLFINCNFYFLCTKNIKHSFKKITHACHDHWKALIYAAGIFLAFRIVPILDNFIIMHIYAIAIPPFLVLICGSIYILKVKNDSRKNNSITR